MKILSGLYAECEECLTEMDAKIRSLLKRQIGNFDELIRKHQIDMKRKEYVLLVAGKWPAYGGTTIYWPIFLLYRFGSAGEHSGVRNGPYLVGLNFTTETAKKKKKERKKERKTKITSITFIYLHSLQRNHKHTLRQNLFGFNLSEVFQKRKINKHDSSAIIYTIYHLLFETCWGMLAFCCFYTTQQRSVRLQKSRVNVFQYSTCVWLVGR